MQFSRKALSAPVDGDNVEDVLIQAAYGWFAAAGLMALVAIAAARQGQFAGGDAIGPLAALAGGYFILVRRSRAVAIAMAGFAVLNIVSAIALLVLAGNVVNLLVALVALYPGWRGVMATVFYQRRRCASMHWWRAASGVGLAALITLAVFCLALAAFEYETGAVVQFALTAAVVLPPILVLWLFTRRFPFADPDPACPWPPKPRR